MCLRAGGPGRPLSLGVCLLSRRVCGAKMIEDELEIPSGDVYFVISLYSVSLYILRK